MARRALSPDEVSSIGLPPAPTASARRPLSPDAVMALGLPSQPGGSTDTATALLRTGLQGATKGYSDEALGWLESTFPRLQLPAHEFINPSVPTPAAPTYQQARDDARARVVDAKASLPDGVGTGVEMAADIGTDLLVPGLRAAGGSVKGAAALGAVSGLGRSEADLTQGDVGGAAMDAGVGAGLGAVGQYAGGRLGRVAPSVAQWVQKRAGNVAAMRALNAAGYGKNELKPIIKRGGVERALDMGRDLLEEPGVIRAGRGVDSVLEGVEDARERWGQEMGRILQQADGTGAAFDMSAVARRVMDDVIKPNLGDPAIEGEINAVADLLRKYLAKARQPGGLSFSEANKLKSTLQNGTINWGNHWNNFLEKYQVALAGIFTDEIDNQLGRQLGPEAFLAFKDAKARAGTFIDAAGKAKNLNAAVQGNNGVNLKDLGVGAVAGGGVPGFLATVGSKVGRERGASALAVGADRFARSSSLEALAQADPQSFGQFAGAVTAALARGPDALRALDKVLRDTSPQWRQMREQQEKAAKQP